MNKRAVFEWLYSQKCEVEPATGTNVTEGSLKVTNTKTGLYAYFTLSFNNDKFTRKEIEYLISRLGIEPPKDF